MVVSVVIVSTVHETVDNFYRRRKKLNYKEALGKSQKSFFLMTIDHARLPHQSSRLLAIETLVVGNKVHFSLMAGPYPTPGLTAIIKKSFCGFPYV